MYNDKNQIGPMFMQQLQNGVSPLRAMTLAQMGGMMPQDPMKDAGVGILHSVLGEFFNKNNLWSPQNMPSAESMETGQPDPGAMQMPNRGGLADNGINDMVQMLLSAFINKKMS